jgi:hypothetical protein
MSKAATSILFRDLLILSSTYFLVILTGGGTHFVNLNAQISQKKLATAKIYLRCINVASRPRKIAYLPLISLSSSGGRSRLTLLMSIPYKSSAGPSVGTTITCQCQMENMFKAPRLYIGIKKASFRPQKNKYLRRHYTK